MRFGTTLATIDFMLPRRIARAKRSSASLTAKRASGFRTCRLQESETSLRLWETITFLLQSRLLLPHDPHRCVSNLDFKIPVASPFLGTCNQHRRISRGALFPFLQGCREGNSSILIVHIFISPGVFGLDTIA